MKKSSYVAKFRQQIAQSMAELREILSTRKSPTANGRFAVRSVEVSDPAARDLKGKSDSKE